MGIVSLLLRAFAAIIFLLLAFEVISGTTAWDWAFGAFSAWVTATILGGADFGPLVVRRGE